MLLVAAAYWGHNYPYGASLPPLPPFAQWSAPTGGSFRSFATVHLEPVPEDQLPPITADAVAQYIGQGALDQYYSALAEAASRGLIPQAAVGKFWPQFFVWGPTTAGGPGAPGWSLRLSNSGIQLVGLVTSSSAAFDRFVDTAIAIDEAFFTSVIGGAFCGASAGAADAGASAAGGASVPVEVPPAVDFNVDPPAVDIPPVTDVGPSSSLLGTIQQGVGIAQTIAGIVNGPPKRAAPPPATRPPGAAAPAPAPSSPPAIAAAPPPAPHQVAGVLAALVPIALMIFS